MPPSRPSTLVWAFVLLAVLGWVAVSRFYGDIPRLSRFAPAPLVAIALLEFVVGRVTRARIARKPGTVPVQPLVVARLVVLAKASSLGGALCAGAYGGILAWVFMQRDRLAAASDDLPIAALTVIASALLVGAALWLERSCRIPKRPEEDSDVAV